MYFQLRSKKSLRVLSATLFQTWPKLSKTFQMYLVPQLGWFYIIKDKKLGEDKLGLDRKKYMAELF
jgi:hypothetical protein